jgi:hypothetical protein
VIGVSFSIDARAGTSCLSGGTIEYTLAIGAELAGGAFGITGSAVVEVSFSVNADARAIGQTGGASTLARNADHAAGAFSVTRAAVIGVRFGIDARTRTSGLSGGTVEYT